MAGEADGLDEARYETVDHPPHYKAGGIEAIDVIEAWDANFNIGSAIKYLSRSGRKPGTHPIEDLEKAAWYINREIQRQKRSHG